MPGLVSTGKEITLVNKGMVIAKIKQNSVSIRIYGTQTMRTIHVFPRKFISATNALLIQN